ncbi:MAG: hypothetical protein AAF219_05975 [Myxococcota bacterium]
MRSTTLLALAGLFLGSISSAAYAAKPNAKEQIAAAVMAGPDDRRSAARVLGYDAKGRLVQLRAGSNDLVCLADDPSKEPFSVACYHRELEPYMARGRELSAKGIAREENLKQRWSEIDSGKLKMPKKPRALYVLTGKRFDPRKGQVVDPYLRWVIYTPYATPESTGLSTASSENAPWLMFPGTAGAHIMISPARSAP